MLGCAWIDNFPADDEEKMAQLLGLMEQTSPDLEIVRPGVVLFDCRGVKEPKRLGAALIKSIAQAMGLSSRVGIAGTRFVAQMVAKQAATGKCVAVTQEEEDAFLAAQSVRNLPVHYEILRRLELLGLHTLGQLAALPLKALTRQFGAEGQRIADLVRGIDTTPLVPETAEEVFSEAFEFESGIEDGEALWLTLLDKVACLFGRLKEDYRLCTALAFRFTLQTGEPLAFKVPFASPTHQMDRVKGPIKERLNSLSYSSPISAFQVIADGLVAEYAHQLDFTQDYVNTQKRQHIRRVMERLERRGSALWQVAWLDEKNRLPERRACLRHLEDGTKRRGLVLPTPARVVASPQGIPQMMRTRQKWHAVDTVVESWELEDEWWNARPIMRSYFRVLLKNGGVYRVFRDGLDGRWYQQLR